MGNAYCDPGPHVCEHLSPAQDNVSRGLEGVDVEPGWKRLASGIHP